MHIRPLVIAFMSLCLTWVPSLGFADPIHEEQLSPQHRKDLAALRKATVPYHDFDAATQPGLWDTPITGCLSSNSGGMGEHFANLGNFGVHDPGRPQALLFEPERDGSMRLVGVEFIVVDGGTPGVVDSAPPPPLFGQSFHYVAAFDVWGLHVWAWRNNPLGMFADWNPMVSCQYAS